MKTKSSSYVAAMLAVAFFIAIVPEVSAVNAGVFIDLSQSHDLNAVLNSGLKTKEFTNQSDRDRSFSFSKGQKLIIELPGGIEVEQIIQMGSMNASRDGKIITFDFYGGVLPIEDAYTIAMSVHKAFDLSTQKLELWRRDNTGKGRGVKTYLAGTKIGEIYPHVIIEIQPSNNELYPCNVSLQFGWNIGDKDKNLTEQWALEHNPRPPPGLERLSLDSPSGKSYDRKDAYREINASQEELERQIRERNELDVKPSKKLQATQPIKPDQIKALPSEGKSGYVWLAAVIAAVIVVAWLLLRKRK